MQLRLFFHLTAHQALRHQLESSSDNIWKAFPYYCSMWHWNMNVFPESCKMIDLFERKIGRKILGPMQAKGCGILGIHTAWRFTKLMMVMHNPKVIHVHLKTCSGMVKKGIGRIFRKKKSWQTAHMEWCCLKGCCRFVPDAELEVCSTEERRLEAEDNGCPQTDR